MLSQGTSGSLVHLDSVHAGTAGQQGYPAGWGRLTVDVQSLDVRSKAGNAERLVRRQNRAKQRPQRH